MVTSLTLKHHFRLCMWSDVRVENDNQVNELMACKGRLVKYRSLSMNSHILCHGLFSRTGAAEICPPINFSAEGLISLTSLKDTERRLSRFTRAITSFRCNCSCEISYRKA